MCWRVSGSDPNLDTSLAILCQDLQLTSPARLTGPDTEEVEEDPVGGQSLLDSVGVNLLVGVWDNLSAGVDGLFPVLGNEAEATLAVFGTTVSRE